MESNFNQHFDNLREELDFHFEPVIQLFSHVTATAWEMATLTKVKGYLNAAHPALIAAIFRAVRDIRLFAHIDRFILPEAGKPEAYLNGLTNVMLNHMDRFRFTVMQANRYYIIEMAIAATLIYCSITIDEMAALSLGDYAFTEEQIENYPHIRIDARRDEILEYINETAPEYKEQRHRIRKQLDLPVDA